MRKLQSLFLVATVVCTNAAAQVPGFKKFQINQTGCYAYFPSAPGEADVAQSDDGSNVYTIEVEYDESYYGIILVDFAEGTTEGSDKAALEELLTSYLDFLQEQFAVIKANGYKKALALASNLDAVGVADVWSAMDGSDYSITGWIDSKKLAVMYISGKQPDESVKQPFLSGFRFH